MSTYNWPPETDADFEALADEAERGYDVSHVQVCEAGGMQLPSEGLTDCGNHGIVCPSCGASVFVNKASQIVGHERGKDHRRGRQA